jgi:hypothetical protein
VLQDSTVIPSDLEILEQNAEGFVFEGLDFSKISLVEDLKPLLATLNTSPPRDLKSLPVSGPIPVFVDRSFAKRFNYDVGHSGRFTLFGSGGASLDAEFVLNQPSPLLFLQEKLSFGQQHPDEVIVILPGLNTLHEPEGRARTAPMRVSHYRNLLGGTGMAHLHTGTQMDQGDIGVFPVPDDLADWLQENDLIPESGIRRLADEGWTVDARNRDGIQCALSSRNLIDTPIKDSLNQLFDAAVSAVEDDTQPYLVVMAYSRASAETAAALRRWKKKAVLTRSSNKTEVEEILRKAVTVVTLGACSNWFPDGPAYIHISMFEDSLTAKMGVHSEKQKGGGRDAVYLTANSPYSTAGSDAHNSGACILQYLNVMMRSNGAKTLREVYAMGSAGALRVPENLSELHRAMIVATKGYEWLWTAEKAFVDVKALPSEDEARRTLDKAYGPGTYNDISRVNAGGMQAIIDDFCRYEGQVSGNSTKSEEVLPGLEEHEPPQKSSLSLDMLLMTSVLLFIIVKSFFQ